MSSQFAVFVAASSKTRRGQVSMSTEHTACGIDLYRISPGICDLCNYEVCHVGGAPLFTTEPEDDGAGLPYADMSDEEIDTAFQDDLSSAFPGSEVKILYKKSGLEEELYQIENPERVPSGDLMAPQQDLLTSFPDEGKFEDNIYRPSAKELAAAMPDWTPAIEGNQLVLVKELAPDIKVKCWSSILVGQIAGGTGDDSIRVIREDTDKNGKVWRFKNEKSYWVTRQVPQDINTPEKAAAHLVGKIEGQVAQFSRPCPECGAVQVKCRAGKGRDVRFWWKGTCEHKVEDGW